MATLEFVFDSRFPQLIYRNWRGPLSAFFGVLSVASLLLTYGFYISSRLQLGVEILIVVAALYFGWESIVGFRWTRQKIEYLRSNWLRLGGLVAALALEGFLFLDVVVAGDTTLLEAFQVSVPYRVFIGVLEFYVTTVLLDKICTSTLALTAFGHRPALTMAASFVILILIGTFLLTLPKSTVGGIALIDALFTATSAVCVTGLATVPTGSTFTMTGKLFILALIQVGGLGLISFITFFGVLFGRGLRITEKVAIQDILNLSMIADVGRLVRYIVFGTLFFEAAGALSLYMVFSEQNSMPASNPVFAAIFHSVSAFCNAGLSVYDANLVGYDRDPQLMLTMMTLIFFGGIGFYVIMDLADHVLIRRRIRRKLRIQSRLVILISVILIVGGAAVFWALEREKLAGYAGWNQALIALFHSTAARTAGFNTIPTGTWNAATYFFVAILMFIGASPGGTGGGIKTSTAGVLANFVLSTLMGRENVEAFGRTISLRAVRFSGAIIVLSFLFVCISTFLLALTERASFIAILFETVSAFGTVGYSAGLTPLLTTTGKVIISIAMLIGRIGPLTLAFAMATSAERIRYKYPEEDIMVG